MMNPTNCLTYSVVDLINHIDQIRTATEKKMVERKIIDLTTTIKQQSNNKLDIELHKSSLDWLLITKSLITIATAYDPQQIHIVNNILMLIRKHAQLQEPVYSEYLQLIEPFDHQRLRQIAEGLKLDVDAVKLWQAMSEEAHANFLQPQTMSDGNIAYYLINQTFYHKPKFVEVPIATMDSDYYGDGPFIADITLHSNRQEKWLIVDKALDPNKGFQIKGCRLNDVNL